LFMRNGINNTRNTHRWLQDNPNAIVVQNFQIRSSVNVWCGMIDRMLISPVILQNRMTGQGYLDFLQNTLPQQLEDICLATRRTMYFQHDGASPHNTHLVREHLNAVFPHHWIGRGGTVQWPPRSPDLTSLDFCLWIGRRGHIEWPPRSPDLTPLDFFLWGYLKSTVYATKPQDLDDLRGRI
ncbi:hypothetical protein EAI_15490, partial [Harpegnathos saltator]